MSLPLSPDLARRKITNEQLRVGDRWRLSWDADGGTKDAYHPAGDSL